MRSALVAVSLFLATTLHAAEWRTYAGGFSSRWKTIGPHGHDQPYCAEPVVTHHPDGSFGEHTINCNPFDFARGNLDNSIGFRGGRERDFLSLGVLRVVGGTEASVSYTEYNLTQMDFALLTGAMTAGVDIDVRGVRVGGRYGAGPFTTSDGQESGLRGFREMSITLPLRPGAGLRFSYRDTETLKRVRGIAAPSDGRRSPVGREMGVMFVASPEYTRTSSWDFATGTGSTMPGLGLGGDRMLRRTAFTRFSAFRDLPWHDLQLEMAWNSSAHESKRPTTFRGYDWNFRSKTVQGFSLGVSRPKPLIDRLSVRYGGGVEVADWRDGHQLLTRDGRELVAGIETALTASVALRYKIAPYLAIESGFQKVYWQAIDLAETRWVAAIVLAR